MNKINMECWVVANHMQDRNITETADSGWFSNSDVTTLIVGE